MPASHAGFLGRPAPWGWGSAEAGGIGQETRNRGRASAVTFRCPTGVTGSGGQQAPCSHLVAAAPTARVPELGWGRQERKGLQGHPRSAGGKDTPGPCPRQDAVSRTPLLQQEEEEEVPRDEGLGTASPHQATQVPEGKFKVSGLEPWSPICTGQNGPGPSSSLSIPPTRPSQQVGPGGRAPAGPGHRLLGRHHPCAGAGAAPAGAACLQAGGPVHRVGGSEGGECGHARIPAWPPGAMGGQGACGEGADPATNTHRCRC